MDEFNNIWLAFVVCPLSRVQNGPGIIGEAVVLRPGETDPPPTWTSKVGNVQRGLEASGGGDGLDQLQGESRAGLGKQHRGRRKDVSSGHPPTEPLQPTWLLHKAQQGTTLFSGPPKMFQFLLKSEDYKPNGDTTARLSPGQEQLLVKDCQGMSAPCALPSPPGALGAGCGKAHPRAGAQSPPIGTRELLSRGLNLCG